MKVWQDVSPWVTNAISELLDFMGDYLSLPALSILLPVFKLFIIPIGGGIPAGVMLAQAKGVAWPVTVLLYLISDILLAIVFEPFLRLLALACVKVSFLNRVGALLKEATVRGAAHYGGTGTGAGPLALIMISFGADPMTGRASALAAGHGFVAGWLFAIAGDMLYFAVIAISTLRLNTYLRDPDTTMVIVLAAMFLAPPLIRRLRSRSASVACGDRIQG